MNTLQSQFGDTISLFNAQEKRVWIGFSGGLDSTVLAHLARACRSIKILKLCHVHHGLQPEADAWAAHAQRLAGAWDVECRTLHVQVDAAKLGLEAGAREARYAAWQSLLTSNDVLLLGHHADDQVETVLQRWCRGAGPLGLAGMPAQRPLGEGQLCRPLLEVSQQQLQDYALEHGLTWIEDPSNANPEFDRNWLRARVLPELQARWPQLHSTVTRSAQLQAEAAQLNQELAELDGGYCQQSSRNSSQQDWLQLSRLQELAEHRQRNLLYWWLRQQRDLSLPSTQALEQLVLQLREHRQDAQTHVAWPGGCVRVWRQVLYFEQADAALDAIDQTPLAWPDPAKPLVLPAGLGTLQAQNWPMGKIKHVQVRFRSGGERLRLRGQTKTLKNLWQELNVLPWRRGHVPLVYAGEELLAVSDLCQSDVLPDESRITWQTSLRVCAAEKPS